jgi:hypothetical protein
MQFEEQRVSHRLKLSALWASLTLCYIYCDYFELYQPGKLQSMLSGTFGPLGPTNQTILLAASVMLAIPAVMIALCTVMPLKVCRTLNMVLGIVYTLIMLAVLPGAWLYYKMFAVVEIGISLTIAWLAYKWPKLQASRPSSIA